MKVEAFCIMIILSSSIIAGCSGDQDGNDGPNKSSYTAKAFLDDYDFEAYDFRSFKKGDVVRIKDVLTAIDPYDPEKGVYPFHLSTETDAEIYLFFAYIRVTQNESFEYIFAADKNISSMADIGDEIVVKLTIVKVDDKELWQSPIASKGISKS